VKEALDNSLDACDEASILPEILVEIKKLSEDRFKVIVEDNGPGILKQNLPNVFGKLLYGSKFHRLRQSRGQQGIGISAVVLYSQLTTGKPIKIISRISEKRPAQYYELNIDTAKNEPKILKENEVEWKKSNGTRIEIELEGRYLKGKQGVDEYVKQVAIVNPHAQINYINPDNEKINFPRATEELPKLAQEIKPHPYGVELGNLISMLSITKARTLQGFFVNDFSRVGPTTAEEICKKAKINKEISPKKITRDLAELLLKSIKETKIMAPSAECLSPIGSELLEKSLRKEFNADFFVTSSRPPEVYRGFPFIIECAIAFGGDLPKDESVKLLRFANRVPLLYQQGGCAITDAFQDTNWKPYGLQQSGSNMPVGPAIVIVHMSSVWVPFTSEAKEAVAHYPEIIKEMKLALQDCGRKLGIYIRKHVHAAEQREKISLFEKYIPELAVSLAKLTDTKKENINEKLQKLLKKELHNLEGENEKKE
ncbi:MAG: DNA topoisomerase VI subunit B, partial [Nanoarchaeota archaeon]|nr:DNA topoisomerase VI subunit B [Nanoarchaeota archaeon]